MPKLGTKVSKAIIIYTVNVIVIIYSNAWFCIDINIKIIQLILSTN